LVINAWFGSIVVATNLVPGIVSLHFLFSFICLFAFIYGLHQQKPFRWINNSDEDIQPIGVWIIWATIWLIVTLGTWAREETEMLRVSHSLIAPGEKILDLRAMGFSFIIHRFLPAGIWLFAAYFLRKQSKFEGMHYGSPWFWIFVVSTLQICLGAVQVVYVLPIWSQTLHIVFGSALLTLSFIWALSEQSAQKVDY
jgi:cytochrome c oxidase assembly protein subunit 15